MTAPGRYLLDLTVGGRVWRWSSTAPVVVDGHRYGEGLGVPPLGRAVTAARVSIAAEPIEGWGAYIDRVGPIEEAPAVIRWHRDGETLEEARTVLRGVLADPSWGGPGDGLSGTVARRTALQSMEIPPASSVVDTTSFPLAPEKSVGKAIPLVFGTPGSRRVAVGTSAAVPAPATSTVTDQHAICLGRIEAENVDMVRRSGGAGYSKWVGADVVARQIRGQWVSFAENVSTAPPAGWLADDGEYYACFSGEVGYGGGVVGRDGHAVRGAADVVRWILERYTDVVIDWPRWEAHEAILNAYLIDAYVDQPTDAWEWIERAVLPILPVVVREGPAGMWLQPRRYRGTAAQAVRRLSAVRGEVKRVGAITKRHPLYNRFTLQYGYGAGEFRHLLVLAARAGAVEEGPLDGFHRRTLGRLDLDLSEQRWGTRSAAPKTTAAVWDDATAGRHLRDLADRHGWPQRAIKYRAGLRHEDIDPGSLVVLDDPSESGVSEAVALVEDATVDVDEVILDLTVLDAP